MKVKVPNKTEVEIPFQRISLDDIVARLKTYEQKYQMTTQEFHEKFTRGEMAETRETVEWHLEYRLYLHVTGRQPYGSQP